MKSILGLLYLAMFVYGAYALTIPQTTGANAPKPAGTTCGSCRQLTPLTPAANAPKPKKGKQK